ncbi:MAG: hypothetical protein LM517_06670 [Nitrosomonas sp.]|nr:hypothetical protein [Nitrosomonas sp.]
MLPTSQYHQLWQRAEQQFDPQQACKWMVSVLRFAYDHDCEIQLAAELLQQNPLPELKALQQRFIRHHATQPDISAKQHTIDAYDQLLNGSWITQEMPYV